MAKFISKVVSGGQTGADRAALDWAIARGIPHGGWCPPGREAEDGPIPARYQLTEAFAGGYRRRTRLNVEDSDGTLILNLGELEGGTLETQRFTQRLKKPCHVIQLDGAVLSELTFPALEWLRAHRIRTLNVAGPRASKRPGIHAAATAFLDALERSCKPDASTGED
ncbi:MAG: hypothetical protein MOGDAGHF_00721 [Rhodocyclaceae bacterium]|nr:hypothetical protein [Rhodocyclaceae bacterium]